MDVANLGGITDIPPIYKSPIQKGQRKEYFHLLALRKYINMNNEAESGLQVKILKDDFDIMYPKNIDLKSNITF